MASTGPVPPRRYTEEELLALRASLPFVTCAIRKLNQHPDLGCILHIPDAARKDPEHFSCKSSTLVEISNGKKAARRILESSTESEPQSLADALGKQESGQIRQWNLRARDSSEHSSQPRAAPATKAAQRSENFQKFYRAVVSPTHVRVTAGGRIVPNTRATAPPPLDWDESEEPTPKQTFAAPNNPQPVSWQSSSGQASVVPNVFAPPFVPLPHGNLLSMPLPVMAPHYPQSFPGSDHGSMGHFQMPHPATDAGGNPLQPGLIKISPPTQFDQSRPFMYNGQWIYPVSAPPANAPLPVTMLGNPGFFTPPMPSAGFMQQQYPMPMAGIQTMSFPAGHHAPMMAAGVAQQSEGMGSGSSFPPMPGMGLTVELLKAHVVGMRFQLKQVEDQFSNIKGQADRIFMEQQRTYLLSQINNMEAMIEHQRAHEVNNNGNVGSAKTREASKQLSTENAPEPVTKPPMVVSSSMVNSKKGDTNEAHNATSKDNTKTQTESSNKSRLSIAAALAPPFQPRSQVIAEQNHQPVPFDSPSSDYIAVLDANPQMKAEIEARFAANALASWTGPSAAVNQPYVTFSNGPIAQQEPVKKPAQPTTIHRSNTSSETMKTTTEEMFVMPPGSVPYLVGTLPRGFNITSATESDLIYPRPLTDEEIRARHLYWGKAPRSVQRGLPKFDGKDFYPPSPVKGKVSLGPMSKEGAGIRRVTTPPPMQNPSFEHLFASPYTPTYRSPAPDAPSSDWVTNGPIPAQPIFQNGSQTSHQQGSPFKSSMTAVGPTPEDFSGLFLEPDASGYMPPSPPADRIKETVIYYKKKNDEIPMTPDNPEAEGEGDYDETRTQDSWEQDDLEMTNVDSSHTQSPSRDDACSSSTVEINLGHPTPTIATEQTFQERVDHFRQTENQTQFLQNILKKEAPMVGTALSGTVSSATAQGYLPPYFGSAAASLTPAVNSQYSGTEGELVSTKRDSAKNFAATQPSMASSFLSENRPFNSERYHRAVPPATTAEGYMRYLSDKDEKDKQIIEQGWNANTTGIGPVNGPDW